MNTQDWFPAGFAIERRGGSRETSAICSFATRHKIPYRLFKRGEPIPSGWVPEGSVEFCEAALGRKVTPDYYPEFLSEHLHRKVWFETLWPIGKRVFIKPAWKYKRFTGFVTNGSWKGKKKGPYLCSEVVTFQNEWRYYVSAGRVLAAGWYMGDEANEPEAPELPFSLPETCFGAIDFGQLATGEIALVEYNHPFAAGWYADGEDIYAEWLCHGWKYMLNGIDNS